MLALILLSVAIHGSEANDAQPAHTANFYEMLQHQTDSTKPSLSYLEKKWPEREVWRTTARAKMFELLRYSPTTPHRTEEVLAVNQRDGFKQIHIRYPVTADRTTEAFLLIPDELEFPAPAIIAMHCHSGFYYYGKEKISEINDPPPVLQELVEETYGGRYWADELARRGYVVLVPDAFYFGSQRLDGEALPPEFRQPLEGLLPGSDAYIRAFHPVAANFENLMAKTIFTSGSTWPGILFHGDRISLEYLLQRPEVDPHRIGVIGLSLGGFRSAHLFGLDSRIKAGVVAGWMTTYGSLIRRHLSNHTWMIYVPGQYQYLDLPDVVTLNAPNPLMVINCSQDTLFPMHGMKGAEENIRNIYTEMGDGDMFECLYFDVDHSFRLDAQESAFAFLESHLK